MINLKFLVVVASLLVVCTVEAGFTRSKFSPKFLNLTDHLHSICVANTGVEQALIDKVVNGDIVNEPTIKLYMKCLATESKTFNENGSINYEIVTEILPEEIKDEGVAYLKICHKKAKDIEVLEEKIHFMFKCYYDLNPNIFIFF